MKRHKDDLGSTIDAEDNLTKMILIEQAIDAANKINETVSRSYAYYDCLTAILDFARESNNVTILNRADSILEEIKNKGAHARALSYLAVVLATFNQEVLAEETLIEAINTSSLVKDDFDRRDAFLDIATSAADIFFLLNKRKMLDTALNLAEHLTKGQKVYLFGYIATVLPQEEGIHLMKNAMELAESIHDPITQSKVYLELANLITTFQKRLEM
ncbi:MAG: hypothetical protein FK730_15600 [Asgard group archaeon]|nr:hypothetical protein [Asgard group archaeon]